MALVGVAFEGGAQEKSHPLCTNNMCPITVRGLLQPVAFLKDWWIGLTQNSGSWWPTITLISFSKMRRALELIDL